MNRIFDRVDPFLKDDLLRGMFELLVGEPTPMRQRPTAASVVNPAELQQEGKQRLSAATGCSVSARFVGSAEAGRIRFEQTDQK